MHNGKDPKVAVAILVDPDDGITFNLNVPAAVAVALMMTAMMKLCSPQQKVYTADQFRLKADNA